MVDKKRSQSIKKALAERKKDGVKLGNPNLDKVRNKDLSEANNVIQQTADAFAKDMEEILLDMFYDGFDEKVKAVRELNAREISPRESSKWTIQKFNRQIDRIKNICAHENRAFELKYITHYDYSDETLSRQRECKECRKRRGRIPADECQVCREKWQDHKKQR